MSGKYNKSGKFIRDDQNYRSIRNFVAGKIQTAKKKIASLSGANTRLPVKRLEETNTPNVVTLRSSARVYRKRDQCIRYGGYLLDTPKQSTPRKSRQISSIHSMPRTPGSIGTPQIGSNNLFEYQSTPPAFLRSLHQRAAKLVARKRLVKLYSPSVRSRKNIKQQSIANDSLTEEVNQLTSNLQSLAAKKTPDGNHNQHIAYATSSAKQKTLKHRILKEKN